LEVAGARENLVASRTIDPGEPDWQAPVRQVKPTAYRPYRKLHATDESYERIRRVSRFRLLSCGDNTFKYDFASEDAEGVQDSTISVFTRDADGTLRHFYTAHPHMADDINQRGIDLLTPVYNMLDLTPGGRDDWYAELSYEPRATVGVG
jgi:predicted dithiol-disulfide oxidoreductase (DUF899 family)